MKKNLIYLLTLALAVFCFISCSNDDTLDYNDKPESLNSSTYNFEYKGIKYSSTFHYNNDSIIIMDDPVVRALFEELGKNRNLITLVNDDNNILYFDKSSEVEEYESAKKFDLSKQLKAYDPNGAYVHIISLGAILYEKDNFGGKEKWMRLEGSYRSEDCPSLSAYGFNDKISAIKLFIPELERNNNPYRNMGSSGYLYCFEHDNFQGAQLMLDVRLCSTGEFKEIHENFIPKLKDYLMPGTWNTSWNDQISSYKFILP